MSGYGMQTGAYVSCVICAPKKKPFTTVMATSPNNLSLWDLGFDASLGFRVGFDALFLDFVSLHESSVVLVVSVNFGHTACIKSRVLCWLHPILLPCALLPRLRGVVVCLSDCFVSSFCCLSWSRNSPAFGEVRQLQIVCCTGDHSSALRGVSKGSFAGGCLLP